MDHSALSVHHDGLVIATEKFWSLAKAGAELSHLRYSANQTKKACNGGNSLWGFRTIPFMAQNGTVGYLLRLRIGNQNVLWNLHPVSFLALTLKIFPLL